MMCEYFGVSRSGFYAWSKRAPSKRQQREAGLVEQVQRIHRQSRGYYGSPRIKHALQHEGVAVSRSTVARLMRHARCRGAVPARIAAPGRVSGPSSRACPIQRAMSSCSGSIRFGWAM